MMLAYLTTALGAEYRPGDIAPRPENAEEIDAVECERLVSVGGARRLTADEESIAAIGPTVAEWVAAGYRAVNYPPSGYASRSTPEEIAAAVAAWLDGMTVADLKAYAAERKIELGAEITKKADIIDAIKAAS
jgi:hypothetical protein